MSVTLSKSAGFCPGVRRADQCIHRLIENAERNEKIYTIGPLIHNRIYNEELASLGVGCISLSEVEDIIKNRGESRLIFVIRTHGIPKEDEAYLRSLAEESGEVKIIDTTCPYVKKIHKIAEDETGDDTYFLLFGSTSHPESVGTLSYAKGQKMIFSSLEEIENLDLQGKTPILCAQTTQNLLQFTQIKNFFKKLYTNAKIFDTICNVTENRQSEAIELARTSDAMIVLGSSCFCS